MNTLAELAIFVFFVVLGAVFVAGKHYLTGHF